MIKSGATAWHRIRPGVDLALIGEIIITYKKQSAYESKILLQRRYPADTELHDGDILLPLTQEDTTLLREQGGDIVRMELQYNFITGAVAKSEIKNISIGDTLATEYVEGNYPDATMPDVIYDFTAGAFIVIRGEPGKQGPPGKQGEPGKKGDTGDVYMPTLYIDLDTGELVMRKPSEDFDKVRFALKNNTDLVVIF